MTYANCQTKKELDAEYAKVRAVTHKAIRETFGDRQQSERLTYRAAKKKMADAADKVTVSRLKDWVRGDRIYFKAQKMGRSSIDLFNGLRSSNCIDATSATFHSYQPRAKRVWLTFDKGDIVNGTYKGNVYYFDLADVRFYGMTRSDV